MTVRLSTALQNRLAGYELNTVPNGSCDGGSVALWNNGANGTVATYATGQSGTALKITGAGAANYCYDSMVLKNGHTYMVEYYHLNGDTTGTGYLKIGTSMDDSTYYSGAALNDAAWAVKRDWFRVTGTLGSTTEIFVTCGTTNGHYDYFDEIRVVDVAESIKSVFNGGNVKVYSGTQPADPDDAPTGTLLVTINNGGTGITFGNASDGVLSKGSGETWSGTVTATGTAGWFRLCQAGDGADADTDYTDCRIDGTVATSGGEINFSSLAFTVSSVQTISDLHPTLPMSA